MEKLNNKKGAAFGPFLFESGWDVILGIPSV